MSVRIWWRRVWSPCHSSSHNAWPVSPVSASSSTGTTHPAWTEARPTCCQYRGVSRRVERVHSPLGSVSRWFRNCWYSCTSPTVLMWRYWAWGQPPEGHPQCTLSYFASSDRKPTFPRSNPNCYQCSTYRAIAGVGCIKQFSYAKY